MPAAIRLPSRTTGTNGISITDLQNQVTRLPRGAVKTVRAQETSLMPPRLLNSLADKEIRYLLAFVDSLR